MKGDCISPALDTSKHGFIGAVLEATVTGLWTWDLRTDRVLWSPETYRIVGMQPGEIDCTGAAFFGLVHPDDRNRVQDAVLAAVRDRSLYSEEFRLRRADGTVVWVMDRGRASYDGDGVPASLSGAIVDITHRLVRAEAVLGGTRGLGRGWLEPVHPDDGQRTEEAFLKAALRLEPPSIDYRLRRADGEYRWMIDAGHPRFGLRREFLNYSGAVIEVHQRKLAEEQLRRQTALIEGISRGTQDLIAAQDGDYRYIYFNDAYRRTFETLWGKELHPGASMLELLADWPEELDKARALWARAHAGETFNVTAQFGPPHGTPRVFDLRFNPVHDGAGQQVGAAHILRDVTETRQTLDALQRTADKLHAATDAANLGIHEFDVQNGRIEWDARVRQLWGVSAHEPVTYETFVSGLHADDRDEVQRRVTHALDPEGSGRYEAEYRVTCKVDGVERWIYATGRVTFAGRTPLRLVGTVQDISARKEAEARLRQADYQKDVFLATLAHELRNPLAPIRTAAQFLADPELDPEHLAWAQGVIQRQARTMALLLDDLLDVSRITQAKLDLKRQPVDLRSAIAAAVETARPLLDRKQHRLTVTLPPDDIVLDADPLRLSQILANLLTNAAKYTDQSGQIELTASVDATHVMIEVRDDGIGIPSHALPHLFSTFAQVNGSHARAEGGLGIGLALVKGLVELHGGTVGAQSDGEGRGSTFTVRLPSAPAIARTEQPPDSSASRTSTGRRVLVADDNCDGADALAILLQLAGHEVRVAYEGRSAQLLAEAFRPDVAILDIGLPDVSGYDVARALRAQAWATQLELVALTGWGREDDRRRAREAGFDHHLTKPADIDLLNALLQEKPSD